MSKVAICIVTKDNYFATRYCIENLLSKLNGASCNLLIYDNNSTDKRIIEYVEELNKQNKASYHSSNTNDKLVSAYNNSFKAAKVLGYKYICVFPCDTIVNDNWLNDLVFHAENISESGVCGIRKGRENVYLSPLLNHDHMVNVWVEKSNFISGVTLFKTELLNEIGGFDEKLNASGYEQDEFCFRVSAIGKRNYYIPKQDSIKLSSTKRTQESTLAFKACLQEMFETKQYKKPI